MTDDDKAIIRRLYPELGPMGCQGALPHLTRRMIGKWANEHGLTMAPEAAARRRRLTGRLGGNEAARRRLEREVAMPKEPALVAFRARRAGDPVLAYLSGRSLESFAPR